MTKEVSKPKNYKLKSNFYDVVVIGGGPAGLMSACIASSNGAKVLLLEKNESLGKKLLLTGGGRCNITNAEPDHRKFVSKFGKKGNFLFTPFSFFGVDDTIRFFEKLGLKTKVEEWNRVFPVSDNSLDVLEVLIRYARNNGVEFILEAEVAHLKKAKGKIDSVILKNGNEIKGKNFILATGGKSHPETGSTGDGLKWLKEIGHNVIQSNPSLVPITVKESWISELSGITLENVGISVYQGENKIINKKGRLLFTHEGLSGPTVLNMSKDIGELLDYSSKNNGLGEVRVCIDFFPGTGLDMMHKKLLDSFEENKNKKIKNIVFKEVPSQIFLQILKNLDIDENWDINEIRREERFAILEKFKKFDLVVKGLLGYDKAIISSGGVDLNEVDFKEMKSKLFDNLFLIGDILDFDRPSGGYSLQLCWTTGYVAGKSAVK
jgi:predicted Rossmann fold flavoprotein